MPRSKKAPADHVAKTKSVRHPRSTIPCGLLSRAVKRSEQTGGPILLTMPPCTYCAMRSNLCQLVLGDHTCEPCKADSKVCDVKLTVEDGTVPFTFVETLANPRS